MTTEVNAVDITPNQDKGVLKEIIKPGTGSSTPQKGNKVFVHYTGRLTDGTVFDSSRDREEYFDFSLGQGQVIKGWDVGVATMTQGEICKLICAPDYAYGASGSPPKIPPNATLEFEVELIKWELEDLSPHGDKGVLRFVIKEGEGNDSPGDDASVEVHLKGRIGDRVFEDRDVEFAIGDGSDHGIVEGLEIALKHFKKQETSRIVLAPKYAFGAEGNAELNVEANCVVEYEVTLKSFEKGKESWEMNLEEKFEESEIVKEKGTKYFKAGKYDHALRNYEKIITILKHENSCEGDTIKRKDALLLAGHLNIAACYLKLNKPQEVIENSNKALEIEPANSKGLFRRGQAYFAMKDFTQAKADFERVLSVDPTNKAAQKQALACTTNLRQQLEAEKKLYKNMFEKMYSSEKQNGAKESTVAE